MMQDNGRTFFSPSKHIHLIRLRPIPVNQTLSTLHDKKKLDKRIGCGKKKGEDIEPKNEIENVPLSS